MRLSPRFVGLLLFGSLVAAGAANAQTMGPDEALGLSGAGRQTLALTAAQRSAIYNAVSRQGVRRSSFEIAAAVGASVPPSALLQDLPEQAAIDDPHAEFLKYAMMEHDVVVVDPINLRVVAIIHRGGKP